MRRRVIGEAVAYPALAPNYPEGSCSCIGCGALRFHAFGCPGENKWGNLAVRDWERGRDDARRGLPSLEDNVHYKVGHRMGRASRLAREEAET